MKASLWITAAGLSLSSLNATAQSNNLTVRLNGERIAFGDIRPHREGSNALIPLRPILQRMGGKVSWEQDSHTVWVSLNNNMHIRIYPSKGYALANDRNIQLTPAPQIINGQTLVPLQFFQDALGMDTQDNLQTGAILLATSVTPGDNQLRVMRRTTGNRIQNRRRADLDAYNRNRILSNANYNWYLQQQDYQRYLNEKAAWEQSYQNYLNTSPAANGVFQGYTTAPAISSNVLVLYNQDFNLFTTNRALWQRNYQAYLDMLNQNNGAFPVDTLTNEVNWANYLEARNALIQQLQNNQNNRNNPPR